MGRKGVGVPVQLLEFLAVKPAMPWQVAFGLECSRLADDEAALIKREEEEPEQLVASVEMRVCPALPEISEAPPPPSA